MNVGYGNTVHHKLLKAGRVPCPTTHFHTEKKNANPSVNLVQGMDIKCLALHPVSACYSGIAVADSIEVTDADGNTVVITSSENVL